MKVSLPRTEIHALDFGRAGPEVRLWVAEPLAGFMPRPDPFPDAPLSVLYVLDANLFFGTAIEMTRLMHGLFGELPPILVVGLAYDTDVPSLQAELRARDFTPTADAGFGEMVGVGPGAPERTLPEGESLGGAARFLTFLEERVEPFIGNRYAVAEGGSTLFGSSLGGLFALYAMLERPGLFDACIAVSPAIWWDDGMLFEVERARAEASDDVRARLVLAAGSQEEDPRIPMLAPFRMVTNVQTMAERIRSRDYPSLELTTLILDGESHTSVIPAALTRGLRTVYAPSSGPRGPEARES